MAKTKAPSGLVASEDNWQARMDCDTLIQAEQIAADPKRYKAALAEAKKRKKALDDVFMDSSHEIAEQGSSKGSAG